MPSLDNYVRAPFAHFRDACIRNIRGVSELELSDFRAPIRQTQQSCVCDLVAIAEIHMHDGMAPTGQVGKACTREVGTSPK